MDLSSLKNVYDAVGGADSIKKGASTLSSIFSKKEETRRKEKKDDSEATVSGHLSPELNRLIDMVLEDDDVTDRELEKLAARAESEGVDPFEFEMIVKHRLKDKKAQAERRKNPVLAISDAFKMAEAAAHGGKQAVDGGVLSAALSLIPGVGQVAAVGSLAAGLIKSPSNLNALKAEIISNAVIPEDEKFLADFMVFCHTQREIDIEKKHSTSNSVSGLLSKVTMGDDVDLVPIWNIKIKQLIARSKALFPDSRLIRSTILQVYESPATMLRKEKARNQVAYLEALTALTAPDDNMELLDIVALLFEDAEGNPEVKDYHKKFYKIAESRFAGDDELTRKLKAFRIKKFGIF